MLRQHTVRALLTIFVIAAMFSSIACVTTLPPAETPQRVVPGSVATTPPAEGRGRLVIDVVDGPTPIQRVTMQPQAVVDGAGRQHWYFHESYERLCDTSPCAVDLTPGNILLAFPVRGGSDEVELELVHVGAETSVYRRALSYSDGVGVDLAGLLFTTFGGMTLVPGLVFLPLGLATDKDGFTVAGAITMGVGSVMVAIGVLSLVGNAPTRQAGASVHFPLNVPASEPTSAPAQ